MNKVLDWLKANVLIVIFAALILGAFVVLPILSSSMRNGVRAELDGRKSLERDLTSLRTTGIALQDPAPWFTPPQQSASLVNPRAEREFAEYVNAHVEESGRILEAAEEFNRRDRSPLIADLYPEPKLGQKDIKIAEMSSALRAAYHALLERIGAGMPPSLEDMREDLVRLRSQYISVTAQRESEKDLTAEERADLEKTLSERRVALAEEVARRLKLYAGIDAINPPGWSIGQTQPTPAELFDWQWDYWAFEDVILALGNANANSASVVDAPVKRLVSIARADAAAESNARRSNANQGMQGAPGGPRLSGGGTGMDSARGGAPPPGQSGQQQTPTGQTFDQAKATEMPRKFDQSFTGRVTNPLYDVRNVRVHLVAQTDRIPEILDAIASQNFMTITALQLWPADPYAALQEGYLYGPSAVSELVLEIETVWLRSWTTPFMPPEVKVALNIPSQSQDGAVTNPSNPSNP